jgi:hypothetical protein
MLFRTNIVTNKQINKRTCEQIYIKWIFLIKEAKIMVTAVRLTEEEQEALRKKCIEINKLLIKNNKMPLRESELVHEILTKTITYVDVNIKGEITIDV